MVDISQDNQLHSHKKLIEIFGAGKEGEGYMGLDGGLVSVKPISAVSIKPGCR